MTRKRASTTLYVNAMHSPRRKSLSVVLALSVLAGGVPLPGYSHSHPGGHSPHRHAGYRLRARSPRHHPHGHSHGPHDHALEAATNRERALSEFHGSHRHWHVTLLYFELTLPGLPAGDDGPERDGRGPIAVLQLVDFACAAPRASTIVLRQWLEPVDVNPPVAVAAGPTRRAALPPPRSSLLCDAARRERSGVLLA